MGENICKLYVIRINIQNIQKISKTQQQKHKQPNSKMGKKLEQIFLPRRYTNGQQIYEKDVQHHQSLGK